jgi:hypothetical protein
MGNSDERSRLVAQWLTAFYISDDGKIEIDWSAHPPLAMIYREVFHISNNDGKVIYAPSPTESRTMLFYISLILLIAPQQVSYEMEADGTLVLNHKAIPTRIALPDREGMPQALDTYAVIGTSLYKDYQPTSISELTYLYNKMDKLSWIITNP